MSYNEILTPSEVVLCAIELSISRLGHVHFHRPAGSYVANMVGGMSVQAGPGEDAIANMLSSLSWVDITEQARKEGSSFGSCLYFEAELPPEIHGFEAAMLLEEYIKVVADGLDEVERDLVLAGKMGVDVQGWLGHHQPELQGRVTPQPTRKCVISIGNGGNTFDETSGRWDSDPFSPPTTDNGVVYFWAPGRVLPLVGVVKLNR